MLHRSLNPQRKVLGLFCFSGIVKYRTMVAFSRAALAHQHNYDYAVKYESLNIIIMAEKEGEGGNVIVRTGCTVGLQQSPVKFLYFVLN